MVDSPYGPARANGEASAATSPFGKENMLCVFVNRGQPLPRRLLAVMWARATRLHDASQRAARSLVAWTRAGGAVRSLLIVSVGSMMLVTLAGLLILIFFLVVAATNAIVVSVLMSQAAAGGFLAVLYAFVVAMYVGTFLVAGAVISATALPTVVIITIATGWLAFFWILWFLARKFLGLGKLCNKIRHISVSLICLHRNTYRSITGLCVK